MALRPQVPKFGNWESEEDVPYTAYFEKAKKHRNGKMKPKIPDASSNNEPSFQAQDETEIKSGDSTRSEPERPKDASRTKLETRLSGEEVNLMKSSDSPTRPKRTSRQSIGSDQSIENSPMHTHQQPRVGNRGSAGSSPMWDRKVSSLDGSHGAASSTPGRSRLKQVTRGEETVDDGPAIPKFGDWDDNDPTAGEGYTQLFNKAREERHNGGSRSPMVTTENNNFYGQNRHGNDNKGCGCFPWGRK